MAASSDDAPRATEPVAAPSFVIVRTTTDDDIELDTSAKATAAFGFHAGQRVRFTKSRYNGKVALVVGAADGMLWFALLKEGESAADAAGRRVQTTSSRCQAEYIRQYGWVPVDD